MVHVWSTRHQNRAVSNGLQRCIIRQVANAILRKPARVENPDKDEVADPWTPACPAARILGHPTPRQECSLPLASLRGGLRGSAIGTHYRHTTPEMAARVVDATHQRLTIVLGVAELAVERHPNRSTLRVF